MPRRYMSIDERNAKRREQHGTDQLGTVRRSPDGRMLAVLWPSPPSPHRWMVTDSWGSCGYELDAKVAMWPIIGAVPGSPAAGNALTGGRTGAPRATAATDEARLDDSDDAELVTHARPRGRRGKDDPVTACRLTMPPGDVGLVQYTITADMSQVTCKDCLAALAPTVHLHSPEWEWKGSKQVTYTMCGIANPREPITVDLDLVTCASCVEVPR